MSFEHLDRTEQRVVGVLIEKQLTVPDTYPLTENALLAGCNQSSNRDPVMELERFQVAGAVMSLHGKEWVARVEGSGRVPKYRHRTEERLGIEKRFLALLCELLVRGPQAPGALRPRVARMGWNATPGEIEAALRELASRPSQIVEQLPRRPRERDHRWCHLLGAGADDSATEPEVAAELPLPPPRKPLTPPPPEAAPSGGSTLEARVTALEQQLAALQRTVTDLGRTTGGD